MRRLTLRKIKSAIIFRIPPLFRWMYWTVKLHHTCETECKSTNTRICNQLHMEVEKKYILIPDNKTSLKLMLQLIMTNHNKVTILVAISKRDIPSEMIPRISLREIQNYFWKDNKQKLNLNQSNIIFAFK